MKKYRAHVSKSASKRVFTKTALKTHKKNIVTPSRGGERL